MRKPKKLPKNTSSCHLGIFASDIPSKAKNLSIYTQESFQEESKSDNFGALSNSFQDI